MKSAEVFATTGFQYVGTPYSKMDCQAFVEACMHDVGIKKNLRGSNAWYRAMDWVGSPEDCKKVFGKVPTGAMLFIWADDGGEVARGYNDGKGNASHMGIVTHVEEGALHSSQSKGCVCQSKFKDKTIRNGGWNCVGLSRLFDYGDHVNAILAGKEEKTMEYAVVHTEDGNPLKLRPRPSTKYAYVDKIPDGTQLLISETDGDWAHTTYNGHDGYVMTEFLRFDGADGAVDGVERVTLTLTRATAEALYKALKTVFEGGVL